ncbi:MAG: sigma-70 family RNA polymerase sigma factor [Salinisphaera sp.]|nr:sigma-70 family RNA polymerase sigma factor [Salinisphaera sp.]
MAQVIPDNATGAAGEVDEELLARIGRGDEAALRRFYDRHQARVYRYAKSRLNDPFAAGDILNEVMLEVWRRAMTFAGRSKVTTWVLGIAHHKVIDHLRRESRHTAETFDEATPDDQAPSAADAIAGLQEAGRLRACMEELTAVQREVMHLAFFEGLSYPEIARIAGCPEGTVKTRVFHAKQALKRCLAQRVAA